MSKVQLECYKLYITKRGNKDDYQNVKSFGESGNNLIDIITSGFERDKGVIFRNQEQQTYLELSYELQRNSDDSIYGLVDYGTFGSGGRIKDSATGKEKFRKRPDDVDVKPFFFLIELREVHQNFYNGFLILERFGTIGIKTTMAKYLRSLVSDLKDYSIKFNIDAIVPVKLFKKYKEGSLREIKYTQNRLPSNIANHQSITEYEKQGIVMELVFRVKRNRDFPAYLWNQAKNALVGGDTTRFVSIPGVEGIVDDEGVETSIKINLNGSNRTFNLGDFSKLRPYIDIDEEVSKNKNNHPVLSSINDISRGYLDDLMADIRV